MADVRPEQSTADHRPSSIENSYYMNNSVVAGNFVKHTVMEETLRPDQLDERLTGEDNAEFSRVDVSRIGRDGCQVDQDMGDITEAEAEQKLRDLDVSRMMMSRDMYERDLDERSASQFGIAGQNGVEEDDEMIGRRDTLYESNLRGDEGRGGEDVSALTEARSISRAPSARLPGTPVNRDQASDTATALCRDIMNPGYDVNTMCNRNVSESTNRIANDSGMMECMSPHPHGMQLDHMRTLCASSAPLSLDIMRHRNPGSMMATRDQLASSFQQYYSQQTAVQPLPPISLVTSQRSNDDHRNSQRGSGSVSGGMELGGSMLPDFMRQGINSLTTGLQPSTPCNGYSASVCLPAAVPSLSSMTSYKYEPRLTPPENCYTTLSASDQHRLGQYQAAQQQRGVAHNDDDDEDAYGSYPFYQPDAGGCRNYGLLEPTKMGSFYSSPISDSKLGLSDWYRPGGISQGLKHL